MYGFELRLSFKVSWLFFFGLFVITLCCFSTGCSEKKVGSELIDIVNTDLVSGMVVAPGLKDSKVIAPLEDAWRRIDPKEDGWNSEFLKFYDC